MALIKADLADTIVKKFNIDKLDAKKFVDVFFDEIRSRLIQAEPVKLSGFGNFSLRDKKQRPGRNPKTKEPVAISARRVVTFKAGQKLKARVLSNIELLSKES